MRPKTLGGSKIADAEKRVGMKLRSYFRKAGKRGLSQIAMAAELGVSRGTVIRWMQRMGFELTVTMQEVA